MRWVLALLAGLLLASLGWSWLDAGDPAPPPPPGADGAGTAEPPSPPDLADGDLVPWAADAGTGIDDPAAGDDEFADERSDGSVAETADGPVLLVVRGPNADPVADADVWFVEERELERRNAGRDDAVSRIDGPELFGQRRRTGPDGRVQLPRGRDRWLCAAQKEDEFGFAIAWSRRREQVVALAADERLVVTAAFADGQPAQVPLSVMQQLDTERVETIWRGASGADGRAVVRHFQLRRQSIEVREGETPPPFAEQFAAVARIPSKRAALTRFAGRPLQGEPVHLVVPALGRLEVTLVDHAGTPLLTPAMVMCGAEGQQESDGFPLGWGTGRRADKPAGHAPVVLEPIAVGDAIVAYARYPDERRVTSAPAQRGPEQPGAVVQVRVPPRAQQVVLAGRVLGPDQRPLSETPGGNRVRLVIWAGERVARVLDVHPVDDGRFDLVTSGDDGDGPFRAELRATASGDGDAPPGQQLGCTLPMAKWPGGLRVELGTFVLQPLPPLAAGVVIDDRGQPVAGALVTVQQLVGTTPASPPRPPRNGGPLEQNGWPLVQQPAEQERWSDLPGLRARAADDGTFAIFAELPRGRLRVRADTDLHFADSVPLASADRTLQIRIARNGIVRGRVLLPGWLADGAVSVSLRPLAESERQRNGRRADISRRSGRFTLEPLHPGRYDFLVTMRGWQEPLLTVGDVFVQPGENDDARLRVIDLRESLFRYRLRAVDEGAQLLPLDGPIRARLQQPDGSWTEAGFRWRNGRAELITAATMLSVQVFGRGIEMLETQLLPGDHDLRLRTLRPALLDVPGARALCGPTRKVRISVILQGDTGLPSSFQGVDQRTGEQFSLPRWDLGRSSGGWLGNTDVVEVPLMVAGKYEVLLRPHATDTTNSPQASVSLGVYELRPGGGDVTTVRLDAQAVAAALQRLDEQQRQRAQQGGEPGGQGRGNRRGNGAPPGGR